MHGFNPRRGDVVIALEGGALLLRPTFTAIVQIETHFSRSIFDVARDYAGGKIARAGDLVALVEVGIEGAGEKIPDDLAERMREHGFVKFLAPLGQFLAHACGLDDGNA